MVFVDTSLYYINKYIGWDLPLVLPVILRGRGYLGSGGLFVPNHILYIFFGPHSDFFFLSSPELLYPLSHSSVLFFLYCN